MVPVMPQIKTVVMLMLANRSSATTADFLSRLRVLQQGK